MSTSRPRGARSGGKTAPQKKAKKLKSEFKGRKKKSGLEKEVDVEEIRTRVVESLEHLGHQKFSTEPGGYDLRSWLKSLRTLLDDFEEKLGKQVLPEQYNEKRKEIEARFKTADTSKLDEEIEEIRREEVEIRTKLQEENDRIAARLSAIAADKMSRSKELDGEKSKLKTAQEEKKSASFFSKLMGRAGPTTEPIETKIEDLEKGLKMLEEESTNLQTVRKSLESKSGGSGLHEGMWQRLEAIALRLKELEDTRQARLQLAHEREEATDGLRKMISELKFESKEE